MTNTAEIDNTELKQSLAKTEDEAGINFNFSDIQTFPSLIEPLKLPSNKDAVAPGLDILGQLKETGFSLEKLPEFSQQTKFPIQNVEKVSLTNFAPKALALFSELDKNKNNSLSMEELGKAVQDPKFKGDKAQVLAALFLLAEGQHSSNASISRQDLVNLAQRIEQFQRSHQATNQDAVSFQRIQHALKSVYESQTKGITDRLYASPEPAKFIESIKAGAIKQGAIGDCYFEAAIASEAEKNPKNIINMIRSNPDGTFTVTFPGDAKKPVTVSAPTEAELGLFNRASEFGTWASVLEKAFGEYRQQSKFFAVGYNPQKGADGGGNPASVFRLLTGKEPSFTALAGLSPQAVQNKLLEAMRTGRLINAGTPGGNDRGSTKDGFTSGHAFSILKYDARENPEQGGTLLVRNPHANKEKQYGDLSKVSLNMFLRNFNSLMFSGKEDAPVNPDIVSQHKTNMTIESTKTAAKHVFYDAVSNPSFLTGLAGAFAGMAGGGGFDLSLAARGVGYASLASDIFEISQSRKTTKDLLYGAGAISSDLLMLGASSQWYGPYSRLAKGAFIAGLGGRILSKVLYTKDMVNWTR